MGTVAAGGVGPVRQHRLRPGPRAAGTAAGYTDSGQQLAENRGVTALTWADEHDQGSALTVYGQMGLGRQTAPRAADAVISGLQTPIPVVRMGPRGVRMAVAPC